MKIKIYLILLTLFFSNNLNPWKYPLNTIEVQDIPYQINMTSNLANSNTIFDGGIVINNGSTILESTTPIQKRIRFADNNSLLQMKTNLELDVNCSLSIDDIALTDFDQNALVLNNNLIIPANKKINLLSDTLINGNGHELIFEDDAQILVNTGNYLKFKNITIKTSLNNSTPYSCIRSFTGSSLYLQDVIIILGNNFEFSTGQLFIEDDVIISGTTKFIYSSTDTCHINKNANLIIDLDTIFTYSTYSTNRDLISFEDKTSTLYLNGCTLESTFTGLRLTKGHLIIDNHVTFSTLYLNSKPELDQTLEYSQNFTDQRTSKILNGDFEAFSISSDGKLIAVSRVGINAYIDIYGVEKDGSTNLLNTFRSAYSTNILAIAFSPDGRFLAIAGSDEYIEIYSISNNGQVSLIDIELISTTQWCNCLQFSHSGTKLAAGNMIGGLQILNVDSSGFINTREAIPDTNIYSINFSPDDKFLVLSLDHGGVGEQALSSPVEPKVFANTKNILAYANENWDGSSSTKTTLKTYIVADDGTQYELSSIESNLHNYKALQYSPDDKYLIMGGEPRTGYTHEIEVYTVNNDESLTLTYTLNYSYSDKIKFVFFSPDNQFLMFSGKKGGTSPPGEGPVDIHPFSLPHNVFARGFFHTYNWISAPYQTPSFFDNAITFGNSLLGSAYNLKIDILSGAKVKHLGLLNVDNT
ncbi:MAG: WD40 repeat domain-containing protein [bacterium]